MFAARFAHSRREAGIVRPVQGQKRFHESLFTAGAQAKDGGFPAAVTHDIGVSHVGVDVDRFTDFERQRIIEFGM